MHLVHPEAVKFFLDGMIESRTAALLEPYAGSSQREELLYTPEAFDRLVEEVSAAGFQVQVHAIGDRAVRVALDSFARLPPASAWNAAIPSPICSWRTPSMCPALPNSA